MFKRIIFEEVSSFYEEGRRNLEERLRRVITLEQAEGILLDEDNFGHYKRFKVGASKEEKAKGLQKAFERIYIGFRYRWLYSFLESIDPIKVDYFAPKFSLETPDLLEDVAWKTLRELGEGDIEHGFGKCYEDERVIKMRNGQELNLGYHFYRARRTIEPNGTIAQLSLPELRVFGEARESFLERNYKYILGGFPIIGGLMGGVVTAVTPFYFPENADPMLYVAVGLIGLGSVGAIVQGVSILRRTKSE